MKKIWLTCFFFLLTFLISGEELPIQLLITVRDSLTQQPISGKKVFVVVPQGFETLFTQTSFVTVTDQNGQAYFETFVTQNILPIPLHVYTYDFNFNQKKKTVWIQKFYDPLEVSLIIRENELPIARRKYIQIDLYDSLCRGFYMLSPTNLTKKKGLIENYYWDVLHSGWIHEENYLYYIRHYHVPVFLKIEYIDSLTQIFYDSVIYEDKIDIPRETMLTFYGQLWAGTPSHPINVVSGKTAVFLLAQNQIFSLEDTFDILYPGAYYSAIPILYCRVTFRVYGFPPNIEEEYFPCYYNSVVSWLHATFFWMDTLGERHDMYLKKKNKPFGPGWILGHLGFNKPYLYDIILYNLQMEPLDLVHVDSSGYFEFRNVARGAYYLATERIGEDPVIKYVIVSEEDLSPEVYISGSDDPDNIKYLIYPNPASHTIKIQGPAVREVKIYDITGKVYHLANIQNNIVPIANLSNGLYLLQCELDGELKTFTFIKSN
ncbi:MAG: T9SS type A sorting domain-containing protein [Bacteroidales bacterium]|nr:T9SS type A sorting domain-containing protein [Bacteroidales bacterium]